jgi:hypothetical protein
MTETKRKVRSGKMKWILFSFLAVIEAGEKSCDWTDKKYLAPVIEHLNRKP